MQKFILFLFLFGIAVVSSCEKSEEALVKNPQKSRPMTPARKEVRLESLQGIREKIKSRHLPRNKYGRRDPFALIGVTDNAKIKRTKTGQASNFILKGIIWDVKQPLAIINGKIVEQGDRIGDKTVEEIEEDSVTLFDGKNRMKLRL